MEVRIFTDGRWALAGSYPDSGAPATMAHIAKAVEATAKKWLDNGFRVTIDDIEVLPPTALQMADAATQYETLTQASARAATAATARRAVAA